MKEIGADLARASAPALTAVNVTRCAPRGRQGASSVCHWSFCVNDPFICFEKRSSTRPRPRLYMSSVTLALRPRAYIYMGVHENSIICNVIPESFVNVQ